MVDYYCKICDKTINRKSRTHHIKSKGHYYVREKPNDFGYMLPKYIFI